MKKTFFINDFIYIAIISEFVEVCRIKKQIMSDNSTYHELFDILIKTVI